MLRARETDGKALLGSKRRGRQGIDKPLTVLNGAHSSSAMAELLNFLCLCLSLSTLSSKRLCFYWSFYAFDVVIGMALQSFPLAEEVCYRNSGWEACTSISLSLIVVRCKRMGWVWDGLVIEISGWLYGWMAGHVAPLNSLLLVCSPFLRVG